MATLESELPAIMEMALPQCNDPITRKRWEEVKRIVSDIRWGYGPPTQVENIAADQDPPEAPDAIPY